MENKLHIKIEPDWMRPEVESNELHLLALL